MKRRVTPSVFIETDELVGIEGNHGLAAAHLHVLDAFAGIRNADRGGAVDAKAGVERSRRKEAARLEVFGDQGRGPSFPVMGFESAVSWFEHGRHPLL